jgi:hypothetical protein
MTSKYKIVFLTLFLGLNAICHAQKAPSTLVLHGEVLLKNKQAINKQDPEKLMALQEVKATADLILKEGKLYSVMNKKKVPPSGDKHDYMSQAPYWWADTTKPDGLPYIRRDGERNPEYYDLSDSEEMDYIINDTEILALAFYFTKDERYAAHAARLLKTWFLDPETLQNPNLNFGQGIPGINTGRGIGIIETRSFPRLIDATILLQESKNWSKEDHQSLKKWFAAYLSWLTESPLGKDEADEHNNHGTYYDVQIMAYALFTDQPELAKKQIEVAKSRIQSQMKPDGSQPFELERTVSWGYTNMNLAGFFKIAKLAENVKNNLWNYETTDGKGLQKSLQWLIPYLKNEKVWEYKQIKEKEYDDTFWLLKMASVKYANPAYEVLARNICQKDCVTDVERLTF